MLARMTRLLALMLALAPLASAQDALGFYRGFYQAWKADDFGKQRDLITKNRDFVFSAFRLGEVEFCKASLQDEAAGQEQLKFLEHMAYMHRVENRDKYLGTRRVWLEGLNAEQKQAKLELWDALGKGFPLLRKARAESEVREAIPHYQRMQAASAKADDAFWLVNAHLGLGELYMRLPLYFEATYHYASALAAARSGKIENLSEVSGYGLEQKVTNASKLGAIDPDRIDTLLALEEARTKYKSGGGGAAGSGGGGDAAGGGNAPAAPAEVGEMPAAPNQHEGAKMEWTEVTGFKATRFTKGAPVPTVWPVDNLHWYFWGGMAIEDGKEEDIPLLPGNTKLKNDSGKLFLSREGKKRPERLKVSTKAKPVEFKSVQYKDGTKGRIWHQLIQMPNNMTFNGFQWRTGGGPVLIKFKGATGAVGKIDGESVTIFDSDGNGSFSDMGRDTVIIGRGRKAVAQPLSKFITVNEKLWEIRVQPNGQKLRMRPYTGPVAPFKLEWSGDKRSKIKPTYLIAKRAGQDADDTYIDLMQGHDKFVWMPVGNYQFEYGYMIQGKGERSRSILISRGKARPFQIVEGRANVYKMGGAGEGYRFDFKTETVSDRGKQVVRVLGREIKIFGNGGEEYRLSMFGQVTPTVSMREGSDGRIWLPREEMRIPDRGDLNESLDAMWFPKTLEVNKGVRGDYSVQLKAHYPPLGKIDSGWKSGN